DYADVDAADARSPQANTIRMACGSAMPMGIQAADAIAARLSGRRPHRFVFRFIHQNISLGRRDGVIQFVTADDRTKRGFAKGRAAVAYKELVTRWAVVFARHSGPYLARGRRSLKPSDRGGEFVDDLGGGQRGEQFTAHQ
ncbi:MAG: oxidoreductase, partial [Stackebrandtia sp.]